MVIFVNVKTHALEELAPLVPSVLHPKVRGQQPFTPRKFWQKFSLPLSKAHWPDTIVSVMEIVLALLLGACQFGLYPALSL